MVNLTIDGNKIEVPEGTTVLKAARMANVTIPTLCDHPKLIPYGGCRLCLVEVEGLRTLQPSCTLPVSPNMVVRTDTPKTREARKFVLTLLFSERNHFCMYCQKSGGDCELQNCAYAEGMTHWPLPTNWKPYPVDASHPDFVLDHNRCILCRRCVRACGELVGNFTLAFEERGANSCLVADLGAPLGESSCVGCGSCVQVCPTGALIDRGSAYLGHDAQLTTTPSTCVGCSLGCGINVITRDNHLVRIEGDWEAPVNGGVLCQKGRFEPVKENRERILTPLVRKNGALKAATWEEAFEVIKQHVAPLKGKDGRGVAALASSRLPAESLNLFKQIFCDYLGSPMVTSLEEGNSTSAASAYARELGSTFEGRLDLLKASDCVTVLGADLANDHQVAGFFIKRNLPMGATLIVADSEGTAMGSAAEVAMKIAPGTELDLINGLMAAIAENGLAKGKVALDLGGVTPETAAKATGLTPEVLRGVAKRLVVARKPAFVYGKTLTAKSTTALKALGALAELIGAPHSIVGIKGDANSLVSAQYGLDGPFKLNGQQAVFLALGDDTLSPDLHKQLEGAPFLAVQASYFSKVTAAADVVLPVEMWAEQEGHFVNLEGRIQSTKKALVAPEGVASNEKVLYDLAKNLGFEPKGDWKEKLSRRIAAVEIFES